ncbi:MAG TPA: hypothetical protein VHO91_00505 [Rhodopila sp.]|nr:hypothetical protein [Rhodopila sp.]
MTAPGQHGTADSGVTAKEPGPRALQLLNQLLAERPDRVGHDFSETTRCVSAYRDELISIWRRTQDATDKRRLEQVNSVLSVVIGGHYPLGPVPWPEIEKARDMFASVLDCAGSSATA